MIKKSTFCTCFLTVLSDKFENLISSSLSVDQKKWLSQKVRAIGYSSSKPLNNIGEPLKIGESENPSKSQRVDIRVVTTTEEQIRKLANDHFKNDGSI